MNLHGIASSYISVVNPMQVVTVQLSSGYTTNPSGKRVPTYEQPINVNAQVQDLSSKDLRQLEGLNIQQSQVSIYFTGSVRAIERINAIGGDLITGSDGKVYLTTAVLERWPEWCKVSATLQ